MEPQHLASKALTCMDEEHRLEITRLKDGSGDLVIAVSITRTYIYTDPHATIGDHSGQTKDFESSIAATVN